MAKPKPLAVITKDPKRRSSFVDEDKKRSGKWVGHELTPAESAEPVDSAAEIYGFSGCKDPHVRCDLDHRRASKKPLTRSTTPEPMEPLQWSRMW